MIDWKDLKYVKDLFPNKFNRNIQRVSLMPIDSKFKKVLCENITPVSVAEIKNVYSFKNINEAFSTPKSKLIDKKNHGASATAKITLPSLRPKLHSRKSFPVPTENKNMNRKLFIPEEQVQTYEIESKGGMEVTFRSNLYKPSPQFNDFNFVGNNY